MKLILLFAFTRAAYSLSLHFRQECIFPLVSCGTTCVDLRNSTENCGACNFKCPDNFQCAQNLCVTMAGLNVSSAWLNEAVPSCDLIPRAGDPCNDNFSKDNYQYCVGPSVQTFVECVTNVWQTGTCVDDTVCGYQSAPWIKCYPASSGGKCSVSQPSTSFVTTSTIQSSQSVTSIPSIQSSQSAPSSQSIPSSQSAPSSQSPQSSQSSQSGETSSSSRVSSSPQPQTSAMSTQQVTTQGITTQGITTQTQTSRQTSTTSPSSSSAQLLKAGLLFIVLL
jgi:hypothetical protein